MGGCGGLQWNMSRPLVAGWPLDGHSPTCTEVEAALDGGGGAMVGVVRGDESARPRRRPECQGEGENNEGEREYPSLGLSLLGRRLRDQSQN